MDTAALRRRLIDAIDCLGVSAEFRRRTLEDTSDMSADELRQVLAVLRRALIEARRSRMRLVVDNT